MGRRRCRRWGGTGRRGGGTAACVRVACVRALCALGVFVVVSGRQRDKPFAVLTFFAVSLTGAHTASDFFAVRRCSTHTAKHLFAVCTHKCARQSTSFICFYF